MHGEALPSLEGERLLLRPAQSDDAEALTDILAEPEVARWWGHNDLDSVREELRDQPSYVIVIDDAVAGWLQVHEETEPDYPSVAFDIALTTALHGRGHGQEALRLAIGPRTTSARSAATRASASSPSASCAPTSARRTARGATGC
jgi:aminoglycoside 6'-N-acetyltransferase